MYKRATICKLQMFGRAGRDGVQSTAILICRNFATRSKTVEPAVYFNQRIAFGRNCASTWNLRLKKANRWIIPCCTRCDYNPEKDFVDPNGFFTYRKGQRGRGTGPFPKRKLKSTEIVRCTLRVLFHTQLSAFSG